MPHHIRTGFHIMIRRLAIFSLLAVVGVATCVQAQPAIPGYADYAAFRAEVRKIAASPRATLTSLAKTAGGRDVYLLTITSGDPAKADSKPAVLIVGSVHAPHLLGCELAVRIARRLVEQSQTDHEAPPLLDRFTFYVIPRPTPDACQAFFESPWVQRDTNQRSTDDDGDGVYDEDGPDDLDGNGVITMMRVEDGSGAYIPHPNDDRIMIEADPEKHERGRWSLYTEGLDNDHDESFNEDPAGGVAFDRNFTFDYPYFELGAGPHQVSEPETRALADFAFDHTNIGLVLTFTPRDNLVNSWKSEKQKEADQEKEGESSPSGDLLRAADGPYFEALAEAYRELLGSENVPQAPSTAGSFSSWAYFHSGRWSLACRAWWPPEADSQEDREDDPEDNRKDDQEDDQEDDRAADDRNALAWFEREGVDGFVDWQAIDHADFPGQKVEVGGFRPFVRLNPPAEQLESLAETHWQFLRHVVRSWPKLALDDVRAESLEGGVWRVTAVVTNQGVLPTMPEMGRVAGQSQLAQMEILLPENVSLVTGHARRQVGPLAGDGGRAEQTWLVVGPRDKPFTIRVRAWSPSVGAQTKSLTLQP